LGIRNLLQWRNRSGFSPDSLTFDCEIDELAFTVFKERPPFKPTAKNCQELSENIFDSSPNLEIPRISSPPLPILFPYLTYLTI